MKSNDENEGILDIEFSYHACTVCKAVLPRGTGRSCKPASLRDTNISQYSRCHARHGVVFPWWHHLAARIHRAIRSATLCLGHWDWLQLVACNEETCGAIPRIVPTDALSWQVENRWRRIVSFCACHISILWFVWFGWQACEWAFICAKGTNKCPLVHLLYSVRCVRCSWSAREIPNKQRKHALKGPLNHIR